MPGWSRLASAESSVARMVPSSEIQAVCRQRHPVAVPGQGLHGVAERLHHCAAPVAGVVGVPDAITGRTASHTTCRRADRRVNRDRLAEGNVQRDDVRRCCRCRPSRGWDVIATDKMVGAVLWACATDVRPRNRAMIANIGTNLRIVLFLSLNSGWSPRRPPQTGATLAARDNRGRRGSHGTVMLGVAGRGGVVLKSGGGNGLGSGMFMPDP